MKKLPVNEALWDLNLSDGTPCYRVDWNSYYQFDGFKEQKVSQSKFNDAKYGRNINPFQGGESLAKLSNGNTIHCFYQDSKIREFTPGGSIVKTFSKKLSMIVIYDLEVDINDNIWFVEPTVHRVVQVEYSIGKIMFEFGGTWEEDGELNHPEDIVIYGEHAFISDMGNQRIVVLDTNTKSIGTFRQFDQPTWQYKRNGETELVSLQDGLYQL